MKVIHGDYYDIQRGSKKLDELEISLRKEWEEKLTKAIENKESSSKAAYKKSIQDWQNDIERLGKEWDLKLNKTKTIRNRLGIGLIVCLISWPLTLLTLFFAFNLLDSLSADQQNILLTTGVFLLQLLSRVLFLFIIMGSILLITLAIDCWLKQSSGPKLPARPIESEHSHWYDQNLLKLRHSWDRSLFYQHNDDPLDYGTKGEDNLIFSFMRFLTDDYYCIRNLLVKKTLDADIVIIGPAGIWILESKFLSGTIKLSDGIWSRYKEFYTSGGYLNNKFEYLDDIGSQWYREKRSIEKTLKNEFPKLFNTKRNLIEGGIAFTHDKCHLDTDNSSEVQFGDIGYWFNAINPVKEDSVISKSQVSKIVETLLNSSRSFKGNQSKSAIDLAFELYNEAVEIIRSLCENQE